MKSCTDCIRNEDGYCKSPELKGDKHKIVDNSTAEICKSYKFKSRDYDPVADSLKTWSDNTEVIDGVIFLLRKVDLLDLEQEERDLVLKDLKEIKDTMDDYYP